MPNAGRGNHRDFSPPTPVGVCFPILPLLSPPLRFGVLLETTAFFESLRFGASLFFRGRLQPPPFLSACCDGLFFSFSPRGAPFDWFVGFVCSAAPIPYVPPPLPSGKYLARGSSRLAPTRFSDFTFFSNPVQSNATSDIPLEMGDQP